VDESQRGRKHIGASSGIVPYSEKQIKRHILQQIPYTNKFMICA